MLGVKVILHPTNFSEHSAHAFHFACSLARENNAKLIVAHVAPRLPSCAPVGAEGMVLCPDKLSEEKRARVRRTLYAVKPPENCELEMEHVYREGNVVEELLKIARETHADLTILGTHGRTGFSRLLSGSTAEQMVRRAPCPVLTLKLPLEESEDESEWESVVDATCAQHA